MKKLLLIIVAMAGLFGVNAQAQSLFVGVAVAGNLIPAGSGTVFVGARVLVGADELGGRGSSFGVRGTIDYYFNSNEFGIGADGYGVFNLGTVNLTAGGGLRVLISTGTAILLQALLGVEFPITRLFSTTIDVQPGLAILPGTGSAFLLGFSAGVKIKF